MLLFGLALLAGGIGVLVKFRDELRPRRPQVPHAWGPRTWVVRTWMRSQPARSGPRAVGRACPPPSCRLREELSED